MSAIAQCEDNHWFFIARRKIIKKIIASTVNIDKNAKMLEIGCGTGGNLKMLSSFASLNALEFDDFAREYAVKRNVCPVLKGKLLPYKDSECVEKFDVICMFDVLEHIDDDDSAVNDLRSMLSPGGFLIATVPSYQFLWSYHDIANNHKRRYTKKSLTSLFSNDKWEIKFTSYFNFFLFPAFFLVRFIGNISGKKQSDDTKMPPQLLNRALLSVFSIEASIMPKITFPFGSSLILTAKKK